MSTRTCTKHKRFPVLIQRVPFHKNGLRGETISKDTYGVVAIESQDKKSPSVCCFPFLRRHHTTKFYYLPNPDVFAPEAEDISPLEIMHNPCRHIRWGGGGHL